MATTKKKLKIMEHLLQMSQTCSMYLCLTYEAVNDQQLLTYV